MPRCAVWLPITIEHETLSEERFRFAREQMKSAAALMASKAIEERPNTGDLCRFVALFSTLYLSFGCASPYLPLFLSSRGLAPEAVGTLMSLSIVIRLFSGPIGGATADRFGALPIVLSICCLSAGSFSVMLAASHTYNALLLASLLLAAALAPTTTLADALALRNASPAGGTEPSYEYGWVRGTGSAAFIVGALLAGEAIKSFGTASVLLAQAAFLTMAALAAAFVPRVSTKAKRMDHANRGLARWTALAQNRSFLLVVAIASIVLGTHAMHDSFAMISWHNAGIPPFSASALWSESVAAEVFVFFFAGPKLLARTQPTTAIAISALAATIRWTVMARSSHLIGLALVEPLHGLSFALLHLACMRILIRVTPSELAGTAQATYAFGIGGSSAVLTFASGLLYQDFGPSGFFAMAGLALASLPLILILNRKLDKDAD